MCKVIGCKEETIFAIGYCARHYNQMRKYGRISDRIIKGEHSKRIEGEIAYVDIYDKTDMKIAECIIDTEDIEIIKMSTWSLSNGRHTQYCKSNELGPLHRLIMQVSDSNIIIAQINQNGIDNRKCNLRICTNQENICNCEIPKNNKSGCKGVYWAKDKQKWTVQITINNKTKYIGRYNTLEEAINARREASKQYYGKFAND